MGGSRQRMSIADPSGLRCANDVLSAAGVHEAGSSPEEYRDRIDSYFIPPALIECAGSGSKTSDRGNFGEVDVHAQDHRSDLRSY